MLSYLPGAQNNTAGWRETGHYIRQSHYFENPVSHAVRRQFRLTNGTFQPYWHSVSAWERGIQIKHIVMSL